jgi:hypothetical protein
VVSKEEVALGRKGSGGAWEWPAGMRGWQGQPRKMVEYEHWHKTKRKCRSLGWGLQFVGAENGLLTIRLHNFKTQDTF